MAEYPEDLRFSKEHEWIKLEGDIAVIGITDYAQSSLGDIVFCELPDVDTELKHDESFGVVESVKSVSDLYSPIDGKVIEKNSELESSPESINEKPYSAWLIKAEVKSKQQLDGLMNAKEYKEFCENE